MNNFITRVLTAIAMIAIFLILIFTNRILLVFGIVTLSTIAIYEMLNALKKMNYNTKNYSSYLFNIAFIIFAEYLDFKYMFPIFTIYIVTLLISIVLDVNFTFNELMANVFVAIYITVPYAYVLQLKDPKWVLYVFAIPAATDTSAYLFGMLFGKHKLIERLSPKKTIEGALGGILGGVIFTFIFLKLYNLEHNIIIYIAAIIFTIVSQIGDLFASLIKRKANIKDYGNILAGHGGIMDRFDSLLLVAPLVYILVNYLRLI